MYSSGRDTDTTLVLTPYAPTPLAMHQPKLSKEALRSLPVTPASATPRPGPTRQQILAKCTKIPPLVLLSHGKSLVQRGYIPLMRELNIEDDQPRNAASNLNDAEAGPGEDYDNPLDFHVDPVDAPQVSHHRKKRERQWQRWQVEIIPICAPAACQLVELGCFPSTPLKPTVAVDMKVLEFVSTLFANIAPNNTAWCNAVETFLASRQYKLNTKESLCKRFGNALQWESALTDGIELDNKLNFMPSSPCPRSQTGDDTPDTPSCPVTPQYHPTAHSAPLLATPMSQESLSMTPVTPRRHTTVEDASDDEDPHVHRKHRRDQEEEQDNSSSSNPFAEPLPQKRPSDYLRAACPLCFGGEFPQSSPSSGPDAIVCLDVCFTQKRNRQARDPPRTHPRTVFVPEGDAKSMDRYMSTIRPLKRSQQTRRTRQEPEDLNADNYEVGTAGRLRVPNKLIAYLRVCGYHQRLYTLDRQVQHARGDIIDKLGQWLLRRTRHALTKRTGAESILASCGQSETFLRSQWAEQVAAQVKPLPCELYFFQGLIPEAQTLSEQSRGQGKDAVQELIELRKGRDLLKEHVKDLEDTLISGDSPDNAADAELELPCARASLKERNTKIRAKQNLLGISDHERLGKLLDNPYYTVLMNAHAAKMRLREKLRFHKFELDRLEWSFRKQANGLWALDVDDEIWQDIGLDEDVSDSQPPAWLCDERVWFSEEWKVVNTAIDGTDDESILYHLELCRASLCRLCAVWQKSIQSLDSGYSDSLPPWGPLTEEILAATVAEVTASVNDDFDDEEFVHNPEDDADLELVDVMDTVALADSYRNISLDNSDMLYDTLDF
ncbi:hypothetical protein DXG01_000595 [Tephrocybe rancida]|nr:hypothetical protein DXG01_000595 [Tephrocybe rancida]